MKQYRAGSEIKTDMHTEVFVLLYHMGTADSIRLCCDSEGETEVFCSPSAVSDYIAEQNLDSRNCTVLAVPVVW